MGAKTKMDNDPEGEAYSKIDKLLCEIATEQDPVKQQRLEQDMTAAASSLPPADKHQKLSMYLPPALVGLAAIAMAIYYQMQLSGLQAVIDEQQRQLDSQKWGSLSSLDADSMMSMCWPWEWPWQLHIVVGMVLLLGGLMLRAVLSRGGVKHGPVVPGRVCPQVDGDFLVLMIGIVPHHLWAFWRWMPIVRAMVNMGKELEQVPDSGFLGYEVYVGLQPMIVQYWRSFDHMKKCPAPHWVALTQQNSGDPTLGVWHETFLVKSGGYEGVYTNMPPFGLGKVGNLVEAIGNRSTAEGRLNLSR